MLNSILWAAKYQRILEAKGININLYEKDWTNEAEVAWTSQALIKQKEMAECGKRLGSVQDMS